MPVATAGAATAARYGLVHGCYALQAADGRFLAKAGDTYAAIAADAGSAEAFRMQATRLGDYLLYGVHKDFLADSGNGVPAPATTPSPIENRPRSKLSFL